MTTITEVPGKFDIAIDGVGYMLDDSVEQPALIHQSIRTQRDQAGGANANIGEQTVNPEGFWRRSRDGWSHGAGQSYGDRDTSDPERFRDSHGLDVFGDRHYLRLCHTMERQYTLTPTQVASIWYGNGVLIIRDGDDVVKIETPQTPPWTPIVVTGMTAGGGGQPRNGVAVLGDNAYAAMGSHGLYSFQLDASTASSSFTTDPADKVWVAKGRLLVTNTLRTKLYNPVTSGSLPAALMTLASGLEFVDIAEGNGQIYVLVSSGRGLGPTRPTIYRIAIQPDGTALSVPVIAFETASYERGVALLGHAGFVFLITAALDGDHGYIRMLTSDDAGNLTSGAAIPLEMSEDNAMAAFDQFVWFGDSSPDIGTISAELGKLNLRALTDTLTPAYAHDLVAPFIGGYLEQDVSGLVALPGVAGAAPIVVAAVDNIGVFMESTDAYAETGYIDSGLLALDLADAKMPVAMDVEGGGLDADHTITEALSVDRGVSFTTVATWNDQADGEQTATSVDAARQFEIRTTLTGDGDATPTLYRHTLKVEPGVNQGDYIIVRLRLFESFTDNTGNIVRQNPATLRAELETLQQNRAVVTLQEGSLNYTVTVRDIDWEAGPRTAVPRDGAWNGAVTIRMKVIPS